MSHNEAKYQIIDAIDVWNPIDGPLEWSDETFTQLAREIFRTQFEGNIPYRSFCEKRGVEPGSIRSYRDIPAVPTDVFKHVRLTTADEPVRTFRTSGTTLGERGEHHFGTLEVYKASLFGPFERFCVPDADEIRMLVVAPSGSDLPDSSLSFMLDELLERFGDAQSGYFVHKTDDGSLEMAFDALVEALDEAERDGVVTMLLGTAFGFAEFFDATDKAWQLADGSRVMETGGFKGKTREISRDELYEMFETRLGVPQVRCVSEYSMTELSSQAYSDDLFKNLQHGVRHRVGGANHGVRHRVGVLQTPPWARVEIVDPLSFEPIEEPRTEGLIRWYDLANTESVIVVQTSDLGVLVEGGGFLLHGRAPQAQLRGCSLTIEEIVSANE
ncbi:hypothetical protein FIV42_12620 [Persicimonas caeni]|uniref:Acyl-protein synthetase LuxE domain-containing protein n=1 Tax=Persicimonas caeni TaxID=2292766 RepID=A0A4Y6PTC8_PERCE|nr:hypothetical protein [Persicimonas caeni]QDG51558.1 hypothetical protein FIV42_12620 [Persicimonas caeni]QED32779.1 hypothetical protein FRD00_12615 [Persicimonas caeni]